MFKMYSIKMYFGRGVVHTDGSRGVVTDPEMAHFMRQHIDTVFDGYTLTVGAGKWKGVSEKVTVVEVMVPVEHVVVNHTGATVPDNVQNIVDTYRDYFYQDSVMVTIAPAMVQF